jgi:hypothetical protein
VYAHLPVLAVVAKLIPANVESSVFGLLSSIQGFSTPVYGRLLGDFYNTFFDVTATDTSQFWCLMLIQFVSAVIPLFFLWLLPS